MGHEFPLKYKSGLLAFLSVACLCLMCGCPRQVGPPLLSGGESSDFNHSLESFLEVTPESEHTAIIHSILFLVVGEMDPNYYRVRVLVICQNCQFQKFSSSNFMGKELRVYAS